jgi:uncharacterized membrane protein YccC
MKFANANQLHRKFGALDWARGLRAGLAVGAAMVVCRMLGLPMAWSALGAFEGNIVDNGGPYRVRFICIAMLMGGGGLGAVLASLASPHLAWALVLTAVFSFVITYLRAAGPSFTTSSAIILVVYFVGLDHPSASFAGALSQAGLFLGGCAFAAILSLLLWPVYPFGHARRVTALCFAVLGQSLAEIDALLAEADAAKDQGSSWTARWFSLAQGFPNRMRSALEAARSSLGSVRARTPARSARGRNLAVLLETADILFSRGLAMVDLAERSAIEGDAEDIAFARQKLAWLREAALLVERGLRDRPPLAEFLREGNTLIAAARVAGGAAESAGTAAMFAAAFHALQTECAQHLESALDALTGIWTGIDPIFSRPKAQVTPVQIMAEERLRQESSGALEPLRENWTFASSALRHALRTSAVCVSSVLLVRALHLPYGEWMALTAVIVLQPYAVHTWQKSLQRVGGTIAGALLAALLVVFIRTPEALIATMCITSFFTLAWFAVDYGWYCFFLTPTFVMLTVHNRHDWRVAGIRALDTILGAALALVAVKLLWTESEHLRLREILARSSQANAAYLAAMRRYWSTPKAEKEAANVDILAPARRHAGLANNESEEALERLMMEGAQNPAASVRTEHALAFATYSRRLMLGMVSMALVHPVPPGPEWVPFVVDLEDRLHRIAGLLRGEHVGLGKPQPEALLPAGEERGQATRLQHQVEVLEKSAQGIGPPELSKERTNRP